MKRYQFAVGFTTLYLIIYTALTRTGMEISFLMPLFLLSPLLVAWMVYEVVRYAPYKGRELNPDEEWGYDDHHPNS